MVEGITKCKNTGRTNRNRSGCGSYSIGQKVVGTRWLDIPLDVQGAPFPEQKPLEEKTLALNEM